MLGAHDQLAGQPCGGLPVYPEPTLGLIFPICKWRGFVDLVPVGL